MIDLDAIKARLARVWGKWPTKGVIAPGADEFGPKAWSAHGPLRCHATPQGRARGWTQANADAAFIAHAPADIAALVAEVERLRGERAAVVTWLRAEAEAFAGTRTEQGVQRAKSLALAADNIERGEHHREGNE